MNIEPLGALIYLLFLLVAVSSTFFPIRFLWLMYKLIELLCSLHGEQLVEALRKKYAELGTDPSKFAKSHPQEIFFGRLIGMVSLLILIPAIKIVFK